MAFVIINPTKKGEDQKQKWRLYIMRAFISQELPSFDIDGTHEYYLMVDADRKILALQLQGKGDGIFRGL